jgi:hypothetical protein
LFVWFVLVAVVVAVVATLRLQQLLFRAARVEAVRRALILGTRRLTLAALSLIRLVLLALLARLVQALAVAMVDRAEHQALAATSLRPCNMGMVAAGALVALRQSLVAVVVRALLVLAVPGLEPQQERLEPMVGLLAALAVPTRRQI